MGGAVTVALTYDGNWTVPVTQGQLEAALAVEEKTRWNVWDALRKSGVPVRDEAGKCVASLAVTALENMGIIRLVYK